MVINVIKVRSTDKGVFITHDLIGLPSGNEFSIHIGKYSITLEPESLTEKTGGLVSIGKMEIDEEISRIIEAIVFE